MVIQILPVFIHGWKIAFPGKAAAQWLPQA
jgi:hypothetical protein